MATQLEAFRIFIPEMNDFDDTIVGQYLTLAATHLNPDFYPEEVRGLAMIYKAASLLLNRRQTAAGQNTGAFMIREKEGDLERQYKERGNGSGGKTFANSYEQLLDEITPKGGFIMSGTLGFYC